MNNKTKKCIHFFKLIPEFNTRKALFMKCRKHYLKLFYNRHQYHEYEMLLSNKKRFFHVLYRIACFLFFYMYFKPFSPYMIYCR